MNADTTMRPGADEIYPASTEDQLKSLYESLGRAIYQHGVMSNNITLLEEGITTIRNKIHELETL